MRVLITGDREWTNKDRIREVLSQLTGVEVVIEGEARGADRQHGTGYRNFEAHRKYAKEAKA